MQVAEHAGAELAAVDGCALSTFRPCAKHSVFERPYVAELTPEKTDMTIRSNLLRHISLWALIFELYLTGICAAEPVRVYPQLGPPPPQREITPEVVESIKQRQKEREEKYRNSPQAHIPFSPKQIAEQKQWAKDHAQITLKSNGGTFTTTDDGSKFFVYLDDEKYPVRALTLTCEPQGLVGPDPGANPPGRPADSYPVFLAAGFEPGSCILKNGDFSVTIVVQSLAGQ